MRVVHIADPRDIEVLELLAVEIRLNAAVSVVGVGVDVIGPPRRDPGRLAFMVPEYRSRPRAAPLEHLLGPGCLPSPAPACKDVDVAY